MWWWAQSCNLWMIKSHLVSCLLNLIWCAETLWIRRNSPELTCWNTLSVCRLHLPVARRTRAARPRLPAFVCRRKKMIITSSEETKSVSLWLNCVSMWTFGCEQFEISRNLRVLSHLPRLVPYFWTFSLIKNLGGKSPPDQRAGRCSKRKRTSPSRSNWTRVQFGASAIILEDSDFQTNYSRHVRSAVRGPITARGQILYSMQLQS